MGMHSQRDEHKEERHLGIILPANSTHEVSLRSFGRPRKITDAEPTIPQPAPEISTGDDSVAADPTRLL